MALNKKIFFELEFKVEATITVKVAATCLTDALKDAANFTGDDLVSACDGCKKEFAEIVGINNISANEYFPAK